ncbi:conserved hypothetical protein [Theileria orientalis strain Shintoku]|uniref:Uncharacterized protein n=1 Tax=Theileria orientalis strain Shintoku TaxID=869250 RepID=J4C4F8_THEOR|nr:conserved hypothetical protein [Theileria orientalis strain Shintoku]BAM42111.1 conserved hypothetical protein [Theileria orientalis strain Shintoku]|eukprot:XP_009692412.1 conserved hypothetical protein [Theileria orientalis strain Shintoku]
MLRTIKRPLFILLIILCSFCEHMFFAHSFQSLDSTPDGNIPTLDVQMVAQKRWLVSKREFQNLQKELSYFIDQEIEKEKKRLIDKEDSNFHYMKNSFMKLTLGKRLLPGQPSFILVPAIN